MQSKNTFSHFQDNNYISKNYLSFLATTGNNYIMWMNYDACKEKQKIQHGLKRSDLCHLASIKTPNSHKS